MSARRFLKQTKQSKPVDCFITPMISSYRTYLGVKYLIDILLQLLAQVTCWSTSTTLMMNVSKPITVTLASRRILAMLSSSLRYLIIIRRTKARKFINKWRRFHRPYPRITRSTVNQWRNSFRNRSRKSIQIFIIWKGQVKSGLTCWWETAHRVQCRKAMKFSRWSRINQNQSTILTRKIRGISGLKGLKSTGHPTMRSRRSQKSGKEQVEESPEGLLRWAPTERAIMYYPSMTQPLWSFLNHKNQPSTIKLHRSLHRICSILWVTRISSSLSETVPLESTTCIPISP